MGYRAELNVYVHENQLDEREKSYYEAYLTCDWSSNNAQRNLFDYANEIKDVWNENFEDSYNPFPSCNLIVSNGERYYKPDINYSEYCDLSYSAKNVVPGEYLALFTKDDFKSEIVEGDKKGEVFYTTVTKALMELEKVTSITKPMLYFKELLMFVPENSLLELNVSEIINNPDIPGYITLMDLLKRMSELKRA